MGKAWKYLFRAKVLQLKEAFILIFENLWRNMQSFHFFSPPCQTYVIRSLLEFEQFIPTAPNSLPNKAAYNGVFPPQYIYPAKNNVDLQT